MRKADYAALAEIIRIGRERVKAEIAEPYKAAHLHSLRYVAEEFAARASVNRAEFLKACGIEP
ncbi:hypothetical protein Acf1_00007 [Acidovorax phage ACF1]|nr:hypothetical protein Acf1_00007 [Acidovorax phage ACF1]